MPTSPQVKRPRRARTTAAIFLAITLGVVPVPRAFAMITGGEGNKPITDPGWPKGGAAIFNYPGRIAWWVGPPFGGGQWHAECRGDAAALNAVLANFARLDVKSKRVVVHDGIGHSFWLAPNQEANKLKAAKIDWAFMIWQPANWERVRRLPVDFNPTVPSDAGPPSQIDVFTGNIRWGDILVPAGIEVVDHRLEAHGFTPADGIVVEGRVTDLSTRRAIAATTRLERIEPQSGRYRYSVVAQSKADAEGRWFLKKVPASWVRVVVEADGFVPRVAGYSRFDEQPQWASFDTGLARSVPVSGRVSDESGKPVADVELRLANVQPESGGRYESPSGYAAKTDGEGRFRFEQVPAGKAEIWIHKPGYLRPGLGLPITAPLGDVKLQMMRSSSVRVTLDFTGAQRPEGYLVKIEPEGGEAVGKYGGSGQIDQKNQIIFQNVPPGRYVLRGHPNPSSGDQSSEILTIDLKGGQAAEVILKAN